MEKSLIQVYEEESKHLKFDEKKKKKKKKAKTLHIKSRGFARMKR